MCNRAVVQGVVDVCCVQGVVDACCGRVTGQLCVVEVCCGCVTGLLCRVFWRCVVDVDV